MIRKAHKLAIVVGVAILLGVPILDLVPGPWKDRDSTLRQSEAQAAFLRASNINPNHLRYAKPKPAKAKGWWIF